MKKTAAFFVFMILLCCAWAAQAAPVVLAHNVSTDGANLPGNAGIIAHATDNATVVWNIPDNTTENEKIVGGYFWIKNVDGNAEAVLVNFYTSYLFTGDYDWTLYTELGATINRPVAYNLFMPGDNATWCELIPFPEGAQRVKAVFTFDDEEFATVTDNITIRMIADRDAALTTKKTYYSDGYYYTLDQNRATITGYIGEATTLTLPLHIDHHIVTSVKSRAFKGNQRLTAITIPASITSVGKEAFSGCTALTALTIYSTVKSLDDYSFYNCPNLPAVYFYGSQPRMGRAVFEKCKAGFMVYYHTTARGFTRIWHGYPTTSFTSFIN